MAMPLLANVIGIIAFAILAPVLGCLLQGNDGFRII